MQATLLLRLTSNGAFAVEGSAGPQARALADLLQKPGWEPVLDPTSERGQALTARAWRSLQVESSASFVRDTRYAAWQGWAPHVENLAIRSAISIPVLNAAGQGVVVLGLFGAYPNQFESDLMRQFSRSLKHRWEQIWSLCAAPAPVIAQDQAREYRNQLLNGGLRMARILERRATASRRLQGAGVEGHHFPYTFTQPPAQALSPAATGTKARPLIGSAATEWA